MCVCTDQHGKIVNTAVEERVGTVGDPQRLSLACRDLYDGARLRGNGKGFQPVDNLVLPELLRVHKKKINKRGIMLFVMICVPR